MNGKGKRKEREGDEEKEEEEEAAEWDGMGATLAEPQTLI